MPGTLRMVDGTNDSAHIAEPVDNVFPRGNQPTTKEQQLTTDGSREPATAQQDQCPHHVDWIDLGVRARCILGLHLGLHTDGDRWFDSAGLWRPTELAGRAVSSLDHGLDHGRYAGARRRKADRAAAVVAAARTPLPLGALRAS